MANASNIVLINPFEVPKGKEEAALQHWEKARDFLKTQPGYVSTRLHRSIQPNARFHMINVAEWESEEAFQTAIAKMNKTLGPANIKGLKFYPALYEEIRH